MSTDPPLTPGPEAAAVPERLSLLAELRVLDAGLRETRVDWRGELRAGLRCAFGLRRTTPRGDARVEREDALPVAPLPRHGRRVPGPAPRPAATPAFAAPRPAATAGSYASPRTAAR